MWSRAAFSTLDLNLFARDLLWVYSITHLYVVGACSIGIGSGYEMDYSLNVVPHLYFLVRSLQLFVLASGIVCILTGIVGSIAAVLGQNRLLYLFLAAMGILLFLYVTVLLTSLAFRYVFTREILNRFYRDLKMRNKPYGKRTDQLTVTDAIQATFACCGYENAQEEYSDFLMYTNEYPPSCPHIVTTGTNLLVPGTPTCAIAVEETVSVYGDYLAIYLSANIFLLVTGMAITFWIIRTKNRKFYN